MDKVTKPKTATMTDVKNKIGKVFKMVDRFGEVTITSYHKPLYLITRLGDEGDLEFGDEAVVSAGQAEHTKVDIAGEPIKIALAQSQIGTQHSAIVGIFAGISSSELWERGSSAEQKWATAAIDALVN